MSSNNTHGNSKVFEYIAMLALIIFAGVMAYAVRVSSQTVTAMEQKHYSTSHGEILQPESSTSKDKPAS